jgi:hypothetical protein
MILDILRSNPGEWFSIPDLQHMTRLSRNSVKLQLEILWNMEVATKENKRDNFGNYVGYYKFEEEENKKNNNSSNALLLKSVVTGSAPGKQKGWEPKRVKGKGIVIDGDAEFDMLCKYGTG